MKRLDLDQLLEKVDYTALQLTQMSEELQQVIEGLRSELDETARQLRERDE